MSLVLLKAENFQAYSDLGVNLTPAVNVEFKSGEVLLLTGDNGSGKSTLLKAFLRRHLKTRGTMAWQCGFEKIEYLPQLGTLAFHIPFSLQDLLPSGAKSKLLQGLDLQKQWNTASGGERQRILLTAALTKNPKVLILDEPFNHVDQGTAALLETALKEFMQQHPDSAMILVSHRPLSSAWAGLKSLELA